MVWRDTPALSGGGCELLLDYNWGGGKVGALLWCGPWGGAVCSNVISCLWT